MSTETHDRPVNPHAWSSVIDRLIHRRLELGMALARARPTIRHYPAGNALIVRVKDELAQVLRDQRDDYEPLIIEACFQCGIRIDHVGFVEAETSR